MACNMQKEIKRDVPFGILLEAAAVLVLFVQVKGKLCFEAVLGEGAPLITTVLLVPCAMTLYSVLVA